MRARWHPFIQTAAGFCKSLSRQLVSHRKDSIFRNSSYYLVLAHIFLRAPRVVSWKKTCLRARPIYGSEVAMNTTTLFRATLITCGIVIVVIPGAEGYDRWSVNDDATNCGYCHNFGGGA